MWGFPVQAVGLFFLFCYLLFFDFFKYLWWVGSSKNPEGQILLINSVLSLTCKSHLWVGVLNSGCHLADSIQKNLDIVCKWSSTCLRSYILKSRGVDAPVCLCNSSPAQQCVCTVVASFLGSYWNLMHGWQWLNHVNFDVSDASMAVMFTAVLPSLSNSISQQSRAVG